MNRFTLRTFILSVTGVLLLQTAALAGPPLLCNPFNIGDAKSLPFQGPDWSRVDPHYDTKNLVRDTLSLLGPDVPVIVRMETLRRATLYSRYDAKLAAELMDAVKGRAQKAASTGQGGNAVMVSFDLGYLAETYRQAGMITKATNETFWKFAQSVPAIDGYAILQRLIAKDGDPAMEFAAALISSRKRDAEYFDHVRKASAGAKPGTLLAENLPSHLGPDLKSAKLEVK